MTEPFDQTALYQKIITKCWGDESFKTSLLTDARTTLAAEGYNVPDWQTISIVESFLEDEHIFYIPLDKLQLWEMYQPVITKSYENEDFKAMLLADPSTLLEAEGYNIPDGQSITVVESSLEDEYVFYIPLDKLQLSDVYHQIIAKCWADENFKAMLLADPRGILATAGYDVPDGQSITVLQSNLEDEHIFYIPYDKSKPQLLKPSDPIVADGYEYLGWG
jgi:hypothetical protein